MEHIMSTVQAKIDFQSSIRKIKELHGVNNSPLHFNEEVTGFRAAGIPYCRLHDPVGAWGGTHYADIPNVFPDFDADPADPASYDFAFTDAYINSIQMSGTEVFYRLGVTIENHYRIKAYNIYPPKDFQKWAEICAGVIRHYNEGWANGFHFNIKYWEIWNEPENPPMWQGTREQFFEMYRIAANHLKKEFPHLKIGGYGSCGFYAVNRDDCSDFYKTFPVWFDEFLKYIKDPATSAPLDFYSWHLYTADPDEIKIHSDHVTRKLNEYGFHETESIFNEWNYLKRGIPLDISWLRMKNHYGASFVAAAFAILQNSGTDKAMYYDALPTRSYCGLYEFPTKYTTPTYDAFLNYNRLYKLGDQCTAEISDPAVKILAASNGSAAGFLLANHNPETKHVAIETGSTAFTHAIITDEKRRSEAIPFDGVIELPPYSLAFFFTEEECAAETGTTTENKAGNHAGLDDNGN